MYDGSQVFKVSFYLIYRSVFCVFTKMNGKMHSETGAFSSDDMRAEILNPFVHKLELDNTYDKIKVIIGALYCIIRK